MDKSLVVIESPMLDSLGGAIGQTIVYRHIEGYTP